MSNAGQNTVTGISLQADVTLLFLLEYYQRSDFEELLVESADWEDFTLKFQDRIESFEVKLNDQIHFLFEIKAPAFGSNIFHCSIQHCLNTNLLLKVYLKNCHQTYAQNRMFLAGFQELSVSIIQLWQL